VEVAAIASEPAGALIETRGLVKHFPVRGTFGGAKGRVVRAVDGVSVSVASGRTLGLVGESGCGKSTLGRLILRLIEPTSGSILFEGRDITRVKGGSLRSLRERMQIVFQDPQSSLDPRARIGTSVAEPLEVYALGGRAERRERAKSLLARVGIPAESYLRFPHEFSGGQKQRIGIARALALSPKLIVLDEPVSALDVSIRAQVINLLMDIQRELSLAYLFISHDLAVVRHTSHEVAVMYLGQICEHGTRDAIFDDPLHPYTLALLSAVPIPDPNVRRERIILAGDVPSPIDPPTGCRFHTRCPVARFPICREKVPPLEVKRRGAAGEPDRVASCHFVDARA
jgi:oligopeptide/dipeptide ABC transporter ATP-binding protein